MASRWHLNTTYAKINNYSLNAIALRTMSNRMEAAAKDSEAKLEAAYVDLSDDTGHQIKGKAKQVQAFAMSATDDLKKGAKSTTHKVANAADQLAADPS
ncbi:MAG: CsbD family protein [Prochlorococcaceae cyanobacterium]